MEYEEREARSTSLITRVFQKGGCCTKNDGVLLTVLLKQIDFPLSPFKLGLCLEKKKTFNSQADLGPGWFHFVFSHYYN